MEAEAEKMWADMTKMHETDPEEYDRYVEEMVRRRRRPPLPR